MFVFIYIINIHSTHIYYVNKLLFWLRLIAINRLTALIFANDKKERNEIVYLNYVMR